MRVRMRVGLAAEEFGGEGEVKQELVDQTGAILQKKGGKVSDGV